MPRKFDKDRLRRLIDRLWKIVTILSFVVGLIGVFLYNVTAPGAYKRQIESCRETFSDHLMETDCVIEAREIFDNTFNLAIHGLGIAFVLFVVRKTYNYLFPEQ